MKYIKTIVIVAMLLTPSHALSEKPSFEATRDWILSKYNKYSTPWFTPDKKTVANTNEGVAGGITPPKLTITECKIYTLIPIVRNLQGPVYGDSSEKNFVKYHVYDNFKLKDFSILQVTKQGEYSGDWPNLELSFETAGTDIYHDSRRVRKTTSSEYKMRIFFNYNYSENNLFDRLENAFDRLKELAGKNPRCIGPKETF